MRFSFLLLLAALALPACDSQYDDGYDDGFFDGNVNGQNNAPTNGATFVDFTIDATEYTTLNDRTATYQSDSIDEDAIRAAVGRSLARAGDGALVMLYIDNQLVNESSPGDQIAYTALPLSRGFDELVLAPNGTEPPVQVNVVGYTASYEFSFDNQDLFFDVVSSAPASDFGANERELFNFIAPQIRVANVPQGLTRLRFRLVTAPATAGRGVAPVDMTNYAAVKAAYNLPE